LGVEHISILRTVNNLGNLYADQGKLDEAEEMYMRALKGKEALDVESTSILAIINNLGLLYTAQTSESSFQSENAINRKLKIFNKFIKFAYEWDAKSLNIFGFMDRILPWISDKLKTQIAFQQEINFQDGKWIYLNI
jgi:tetratricopeptide (TPR) repeat protein